MPATVPSDERACRPEAILHRRDEEDAEREADDAGGILEQHAEGCDETGGCSERR